MMEVQEQPRKSGALGKIRLVLRLVGAAPGLLLAANREYRQFKNAFLEQAAAEGLPEELARDIMAEYRPLRLARSLNPDKKSRQEKA